MQSSVASTRQPVSLPPPTSSVPLIIRGVHVQFPFRPYDIQVTYMEKVIACLQQGINGILESPTGTGKTLCLLCAALGWAESVRAELALSVQDLAQLEPEIYANLSAQLKQATGSAATNSVNHSSGFAAGRSVIGAPKIIFTSRTHSQLSQVVQELKRTAYRHIRATVIGSRDQLCTHPEVSQETNHATKLHMCQARVKARSCGFYNQVEVRRQDTRVLDANIMDIEDLAALGKKLNFCPYYMARSLRDSADVLFMPYNYLLDARTRRANGVELHNSVVIFDEAHNIEKMCEDAASLQIRSTDIALCADELTYVLTQLAGAASDSQGGAAGLGDIDGELGTMSALAAASDINADNVILLKTMLLELEKALDNVPLTGGRDGAISDGDGGVSFPGSFMFDLLEQAHIVHSKRALIIEELDRLISFLSGAATSVFSRRGNGLQKFADLIKTVFSRDTYSAAHMERVKRCYKVHIAVDTGKSSTTGKRAHSNPWETAAAPKTPQCRVLSYWCFSSGFGMCELLEQGVKCVILTSGTLAPLETFASELQISLPVRLENPHIIADDQVWVGCVRRGPDGVELNSSYANRSNARYLQSLGQTLINISRLVPDGLLVFFPSYSMLRACRDSWQASDVWRRLAANKGVFCEPSGRDQFAQTMTDFYREVAEPAAGSRGACFLAVCRGKVSEGLDFADANGRAVVITGLPYPPLKDPRVVLKRRYLDECRHQQQASGVVSAGSQEERLSGQQWYTLEASRAINQAIGRVIRHRRDYGAVLLCDARLADKGFCGQLSAWLRPRMRVYDNFGAIVRQLTVFFRECRDRYPCEQKFGAGSKERAGGTNSVAGYASFGFTESRSVVKTATGGTDARKLSTSSHLDCSQDLSRLYRRVDIGNGGGLSKESACSKVLSSKKVSLFEEEARWDDRFGRESEHSTNSNVEVNGSETVGSQVLSECSRIQNECLVGANYQSGGTRSELTSGTSFPLAVASSSRTSSKYKFKFNPADQVLSKETNFLKERTQSCSPQKTHSKRQPSSPNDSRQKRVAEYILRAKRTLSSSQYALFSAAIKDYNSSRNYDRVIEQLGSVLLAGRAAHEGISDANVPVLSRLFADFGVFVQPAHRQRFVRSCQELTGIIPEEFASSGNS